MIRKFKLAVVLGVLALGLSCVSQSWATVAPDGYETYVSGTSLFDGTNPSWATQGTITQQSVSWKYLTSSQTSGTSWNKIGATFHSDTTLIPVGNDALVLGGNAFLSTGTYDLTYKVSVVPTGLDGAFQYVQLGVGGSKLHTVASITANVYDVNGYVGTATDDLLSSGLTTGNPQLLITDPGITWLEVCETINVTSGGLLDTTTTNYGATTIPEPASLVVWALLGAGWVGTSVWRGRRGIGGGAKNSRAWSPAQRDAIQRIVLGPHGRA